MGIRNAMISKGLTSSITEPQRFGNNRARETFDDPLVDCRECQTRSLRAAIKVEDGKCSKLWFKESHRTASSI